MSHYVDGYLLPLAKKNIDEYRRIAEKAGKIWKEHGALDYKECIGEDLDVKDLLPFPTLFQVQPDETVVFSWIMFESRAHRDEVNAKVMQDPRLKDSLGESMPFDCKRMAYGGFATLVEG